MGAGDCRRLGRKSISIAPSQLPAGSPKLTSVEQNRVTAHSAILDWQDGARRHLARITPQAEEPYETPFVPRGSA